MTESPEDATFNGFAGVNDRWSDESMAAIERRHREIEAPLKALRKIHRAKLTAADKLSYDLFRRNTEEMLEGTRFREELLPVSQLGGPQQSVAQILAIMPHDSAKELADIFSRLEKIPALIDQTMALMQEGLKQGVTPPKITMRDVPDQIKNVLEEDPDKNPLLASLRKVKDEAVHIRAAELLKHSLLPAFQRFRDFVKDTYLPNCRESIAWTALPNGADWYAYRVRTSTTTRLSPKEIHEIGLSEVKRIRGEMDAVMKSTGFKGSFAEFKEYLRTDSKFFYTDAADLLTGYRDIAKRIDPQLIHLFGKLPRLTYGVLPVPSYAEKSQTTAYYEPGSPDSGRAGNFFANTYNLKSRPKWEMESLTLHEAVPVHHLQIALAQELENVPEFRRFGFYTAFVEGWGIYAESLGGAIGLYEDPYSKFGQLTYEMWRAIRLVVDTGMHSLGWTREQALDFFKEYTGKSEHDITVEVDRYIVWSGQALAYKIGQLKITELRENAKKQLGDKFDIRRFHDVLLGSGAVPLDTLEAMVTEWTSSQKKLR
ncbi:MAG: DUF885 domain-containing protein [Deltaproteobacteria bacterium]|nr:DUF885 domain-containing protein [Deltaproteobacteria bacterium]